MRPGVAGVIIWEWRKRKKVKNLKIESECFTKPGVLRFHLSNTRNPQ